MCLSIMCVCIGVYVFSVCVCLVYTHSVCICMVCVWHACMGVCTCMCLHVWCMCLCIYVLCAYGKLKHEYMNQQSELALAIILLHRESNYLAQII